MNAPITIRSVDARRLSSIAARLQSSHDGEVVNAGRALVRELGKHDIRVGELIEGALSPKLPPRAAEPFPRSSSAPRPVSPLRSHQRQARMCLGTRAIWNEREIDFLRTMAVTDRAISARQGDWLHSLASRAREMAR